MENINVILLRMMQRCLFGISSGLTEKVDWYKLYELSMSQTVAAMVFDSLSAEERSMMDKDLAVKWENIATQTFLQFSKNLSVQDELASILNENDIPYCIMKGLSAAKNYPKPELRMVGDIDFIVRNEDMQRCEDILVAGGFLKGNSNDYHIALTKKGVMLEQHRNFSGLPNNEIGEIIKSSVRETLNNGKMNGAELMTVEFNVFPAGLQAVSLAQHMYAHFNSSGIGLRHICDWAMFVYRCTEEEWKESEKLLKETGLYKFARVITKLCEVYIGLPQECVRFCDDVDLDVVDAVMNTVFDSGNFGRNQDSTQNLAKKLVKRRDYAEDTSLIRRFSMMYLEYVNSWKNRWFYYLMFILAPFYMIFRFLFKRVFTKNGVDIKKLKKEMNRQKRVVEAFEIYVPEKEK